MNCRDLKEQLENGQELSKQEQFHLKACEDCKTFQSENFQLSQMIASLPKVQAPKDFEFGFKAKLAQSKLKKPLSPFWQTLRYFLPLTAAALIFGFVVVNSNLFAPTPGVTQVEEKKADTEQAIAPENIASFDEKQEATDKLVADNTEKPVEESTTEKAVKPDTTIEKNTPPEIAESKPKTFEKKDSEEEDEILTKDIRPEKDSPKIFNKDTALTSPDVINPPGVNPDKKITTKINQTAKSFTAKEVLSQLGIETSTENGRLKVSSIRENSAGASSGVKVGDFVTAIDGQELTAKPLKNRTVQGKTLKILRDKKELNIVIRNN